MIYQEDGSLVLSSSGFIISPKTSTQEMEKAIPDLIVQKSTTNNGYTHYNCWFDIEPGHYVYVYLISYNDKITSVRIMPQYSSPKPASLPLPDEDNFDIIKKWYYNYFDYDKLSFQWGEVWLTQGNDAIYHTSEIHLRYRR